MDTFRKFLLMAWAIIFMCPTFAVKPNNKTKTMQTEPIPVEVVTVKTATIPEQVEALGSLTAPQSVNVSSEVDGRIAKIFFKDGQDVAKSMPIIQLDNAADQAGYDSAVAALKVARNKYNRSQQLWAQGGISKQELEQLKADVETKESNLKSAQVALNQKELTAPFNGTLGSFQANEGDFIKAGTVLVTLVNTKELKVEYSLPESVRPNLQLDQHVQITTRAYPKQVFYGTVTFISPQVDVATRSIAIQAQVPNDKGLLSPGMFVNVAQNIKEIKDALVIPDQAITADVQGYSVYIIKDGIAHFTTVKVGVRLAGQAQILSGLRTGDVVVTAGQQKLQDGNPVKIVATHKSEQIE